MALNQLVIPVSLHTTVTTYISNPSEGNINPEESNWLKLFTLATAERSKESKITISQDKGSSVMSVFRQDSNSFGWGILTNRIEDISGVFHCILEDSDKVTLDLVKKQAMRTFHTFAFPFVNPLPPAMNVTDIDPAGADSTHLKMFYRRTRSRMIANRIQNSLTATSWSTLFPKGNIFLDFHHWNRQL